MARTLCKTAQIMIGITSGQTTTATQISPLTAWDLDLSCSEIDVTAYTDSNKQYQPGISDLKGSFSLIADDESATLTAIDTARKNQSKVELYVRLQGTGTGKEQMKFDAYITSYKISISTDSKIEISAGFVGASAVDYTVQA